MLPSAHFTERETKAQGGVGHTGNNGRLEASWLLPTLLLHHALATNAPVSIYAVDFQLAPTHVFHGPFWDVCSVLTSHMPLHLVSSVGVASDTFSHSTVPKVMLRLRMEESCHCTLNLVSCD